MKIIAKQDSEGEIRKNRTNFFWEIMKELSHPVAFKVRLKNLKNFGKLAAGDLPA